MGTIGGNIGTASPIGDMPPVLLALETPAQARLARGTRDLPLEDFFLGYRKTALAPDEVIQSLTMPRCGAGEVFFCDKLSKRRDQDISTVAGAYRLRIKDGKIEDVRIGFGGMAATPKRREPCRGGAEGPAFSAATFETRRGALAKDFQPIDDWRGTAAYRLQAAANLLRRLDWRIAEPAARRSRSRRCERPRSITAQRHDSALKHVTGQALYIDDMPSRPAPCMPRWC